MAIVVVILAALAISLPICRTWLGVLLGMEAVVWFGLCTTYSRGGFTAAWAGLAYAGVLNLRGRDDCVAAGQQAARCGPWLALRVVIAVGCLMATGFHGRLSPEYTAADASVLNRLVLWRGAARMVVDSRGSGWGLGLGAPIFSEWYAPQDLTHNYLTFVNLFLTLAVDLGVVWFAGAIAAIGALLATPFVAQRSQVGGNNCRWYHCISVIAGAVLVVSVVANIFSVLLLSNVCNAITLLTIVVLAIGFVHLGKARWKWPCLAGLGAAGAGAAALVLVGIPTGGKRSSIIPDIAGNRVEAIRGRNPVRMLWIQDGRSFDALSGRMLRSWLEADGDAVSVTTQLSERRPESAIPEERFDYACLWGDRWWLVGHVNATRRLLIFPSETDERAELDDFDEVILNPSDVTGENEFWSARAAAIGARVRFAEPRDVMQELIGRKDAV